MSPHSHYSYEQKEQAFILFFKYHKLTDLHRFFVVNRGKLGFSPSYDTLKYWKRSEGWEARAEEIRGRSWEQEKRFRELTREMCGVSFW